MASTRSSAWPLAWVWIVLITYASLHPFTGWRWPPHPNWVADLTRLWLPAPHSSPFDLIANFGGYLPLGLLTTLGWMRSGERPLAALSRALLLASAVSLMMELTQTLLPLRAPSRIDWATNSLGALTGAALVVVAARLGGLTRWQRWRDQWFVPHGAVGLALLLSWPVALLFPPPLPFGLGQALGLLGDALSEFLADSDYADWLPSRDPQAHLAPASELLVVTLGALAPCFVGFEMLRRFGQRLILLGVALASGWLASTLSTALNFAPEHALAWISAPVGPGLVLSALLGVVLAALPHRGLAALGLMALTCQIVLVNQLGADPYFALSLQAWEQGHFIRFHGLAQWLGWVWPYAALTFLLSRVTARR
jgi:VanZ family protein